MCARIFTVERLTLPISVYIVTALAALSVALTKSFTNKDEISASLISSIFVVLYIYTR